MQMLQHERQNYFLSFFHSLTLKKYYEHSAYPINPLSFNVNAQTPTKRDWLDLLYLDLAYFTGISQTLK